MGLIALGLLVLFSGVALLMLVAVAGVAVGGGAMLVRRLLGHGPRRSSTRVATPLELDADFEILPVNPPGGEAGPRLPVPGGRSKESPDL